MNLLLVVSDATRADHLSCYGYPRLTTPTVDGLASEGCLFTHCFAADNTTDPCFTSLFTGRYPVSHGIISMFGPDRRDRWLDDDTPVLAELLANRGYATAAVDTLQKWFRRGFEQYIMPTNGWKGVGLGEAMFPGPAVTEHALAWVDRLRPGTPYFLFLHYWDCHAPYEPPVRLSKLFQGDELSRQPLPRQVFVDPVRSTTYGQGTVRAMIDNYDRELAGVDIELQRLLGELRKRGLLEDTLVVFTADHGESIYERDVMAHHYNLHDPVVHIPLVLWAPGRLPARRVRGLASQVDVMPTLLEILGLPTPAGVEGLSLLPAVERGRTGRPAVFLEEGSVQRARAVRTERWKLVRNLKPPLTGAAPRELYDLQRDPGELHNLCDHNPRVAANLERRLREFVTAAGVDYDREGTAPWQCLFGPYRNRTF